VNTTYNALFSQIQRQAKQDEHPVWPADAVRGAIIDALRELAASHPDARMDKRGRLRSAPAEWPEDPSENLPIDDYYAPAAAALALAKLHLRDGQDVKDESAGAFWLGRYKELAGG
jgi:hypothetical protein